MKISQRAAQSIDTTSLQQQAPIQETPKTQTDGNTYQTGTPSNDPHVGNFAQSAQVPTSKRTNILSLQIQEGMGTTDINAATQAAPMAQSAPIKQVSTPKLTEAQQKEQVIKKFYKAMEEKDLDTILSLYHPDATFSDPAYPNLKGDKLKSMWKLITSNKGLKIESSQVKVQADGSVTGHWDADYELIKGNPIHNSIDSKFEFKDGKIIKHTDSFDFSKWADQAVPGVFGKLIGTRVGQFLMQKLVLPFTLR
ncbi:MAG: hypothetical protein CL920_29130 [Deltaproteobacteria bacterium]|nr:hypothetical protein [Deltaproteobacteria bacterium]|tara:strand:+ start:371 stop:1126 length:756 start_codon:yes stop_codon:yes gene_type:complete